jgi:hypothetical protein
MAEYPVKDQETILSGQVIQTETVAGVIVWKLADATAKGLQTYIAINDSNDEDVLEAGNLPGLSGSGQFEIATPFYSKADAADVPYDYPIDTLLAVDDAAPGYLRPAKADEAVVGQVTRTNAPTSLDGINSNVVAGSEVITFRTVLSPSL